VAGRLTLVIRDLSKLLRLGVNLGHKERHKLDRGFKWYLDALLQRHSVS